MQPQTHFLYSTEELRSECENRFDAYIVGSDQVWRPIYVPNIENFFLDFTKGWNVCRIAYAASFGTITPEYTDVQKVRCGDLIKLFDAISLREQNGLEVFKRNNWNFKEKPSTVLDPTMLLSHDYYSSLIKNKTSESKGKIFTYILDSSEGKDQIIKEVSHCKKCKTVSLYNSKQQILPSIESWLASFRDSEFVITDSFHSQLSAIIVLAIVWCYLIGIMRKIKTT